MLTSETLPRRAAPSEVPTCTTPTYTTPTYTTVASPLGELLLIGQGTALTGIYLPEHRRGRAVEQTWRRDDAALREAARQLQAYFAGELRTFDLELAAGGTPFQQRVWERLRAIPYGEVRTYGTLAAEIGLPGAARAVGSANARNPLSIVVPCHRVIGGSGLLSGYAGGVARKSWLLEHERGQLAGGDR